MTVYYFHFTNKKNNMSLFSQFTILTIFSGDAIDLKFLELALYKVYIVDISKKGY